MYVVCVCVYDVRNYGVVFLHDILLKNRVVILEGMNCEVKMYIYGMLELWLCCMILG